MRKIITLSTMIILLAGAIFTSPFLALPSNGDSVIWNASVFVSETNELSDSVEFGEASDAIDGPPVDSYDTLKPPAPMVPYLRMYFTDNLPSPYDVLWSDFRQYPGSMKIWNLSIQWVPRDYSSSTLVTISWNPDELLISEYDHITLNSETGTLLQDMLLNDNYSFNCPAMIPQNFKIICTRTNFPPISPSTPDGITSGYHGSSFQRFYPFGFTGQRHRPAPYLHPHRQMAAELCVPDRFECMDLHPLRSGGAGGCSAYGQLPDHQSGHCQPGRFPAVRVIIDKKLRE